MFDGEQKNSSDAWVHSDDPLGSLKRYDLSGTRLHGSLWVAPNPALVSRTLHLPHHLTNMVELLTSLFCLGDFPLPRSGGNLRVRLGNLWVYDGEGGSLTSPIDLTLSYRRSSRVLE
jgi:hypothetical protein